jgi:DNA polymerase III delta prime subunit
LRQTVQFHYLRLFSTVNPSDAGIYDRVVITDIIKQIAQTNFIDTNGQRDFRVIVLSEVDELTKDAQHALRRTMEKYVATCRLILCVNSTSRVIPAIKSRCLGIRVAAPSVADIVKILNVSEALNIFFRVVILFLFNSSRFVKKKASNYQSS